MPFLEHFCLSDYPFGITPNPKVFYPFGNAQSILAAIEFSLMRGDGLVKVSGEVGTGKTLLCRMLVERLKSAKANTACLNSPVDVASLPAAIAREFGVKPKKNEDAATALRDYLSKEHAKKKRNILIVDEAQSLGPDGLETVRLLSNLETDTQKMLQIALFGQRELDKLLRRADLRQVAQRLNFSFETKPFSRQESMDYLRFRMESCAKKSKNKKASGGLVFSPEAAGKIASASRGLPRVIHLLADKALFAAYAESSATVERKHVKTAIKETPDVRFGWFWR